MRKRKRRSIADDKSLNFTRIRYSCHTAFESNYDESMQNGDSKVLLCVWVCGCVRWFLMLSHAIGKINSSIVIKKISIFFLVYCIRCAHSAHALMIHLNDKKCQRSIVKYILFIGKKYQQQPWNCHKKLSVDTEMWQMRYLTLNIWLHFIWHTYKKRTHTSAKDIKHFNCTSNLFKRPQISMFCDVKH